MTKLKIRTGFLALQKGYIKDPSEAMVIALIREYGKECNLIDLTHVIKVNSPMDEKYLHLQMLWQDSKRITDKEYRALFEPYTDHIFKYRTSGVAEPNETKISPLDALEMLLHLYRQPHIGYIQDLKVYYYWNKELNRYKIDSCEVRNIITRFLEEFQLAKDLETINGMMTHLQGRNHHEFTDFDQNLNILVFTNGFYHLDDKSFEEYTIDPSIYLCLKGFDFAYYGGVEELPALTQQYIDSLGFCWYDELRLLCLLKGTIDRSLFKNKKAVLFHGPHDSGKSMLYSKMTAMMGQEATTLFDIYKLDKGNFAKACLPNKQLACADDTSGSSLTNEVFAQIKNLTGGHDYDAELKGVNTQTYHVTFTLWFTCNRLFGLPDDEDLSSFLSRIYIVRFLKTQPKNEAFRENWLSDKEDHAQLVSFLLNMPDIPLDFPVIYDNLPYEDRAFTNILEYWNIYHSPLYKCAVEFFEPAEGMKCNQAIIYDIFEDYCSLSRVPFSRFNKEHIKIIRQIITKLGGKSKESNGVKYIHGIKGKGQTDGLEEDTTLNKYMVEKTKVLNLMVQICPEEVTFDYIVQRTELNEKQATNALKLLLDQGKLGYSDGDYFLINE